MNKKLVIGGVVLLLVGGGAFLAWQNGKDARELNKNLPKGVRVTKSLFGNEYTVVNNIDGYEFRVPIAPSYNWNGVKQIIYEDAIQEDIGYGVELSEGLGNKVLSESILGVQEGRGWQAMEMQRIEFDSTPKLEDIVNIFIDVLSAPYQETRLSIIYATDVVQMGGYIVAKLQGTTRSPSGGELAQSESFYIFQKNSVAYIITNISSSEELIKEIIASGDW